MRKEHNFGVRDRMSIVTEISLRALIPAAIVRDIEDPSPNYAGISAYSNDSGIVQLHYEVSFIEEWLL